MERTTSSSRAAALDVRADLPAARAAAGDALTDRLPELLDCKALRAELGVTRVTAEAIMRAVPTVQIAGLRKVYVKREDVRRYLDAHTFARDRLRREKAERHEAKCHPRLAPTRPAA